jgi:hypothetical protein
MPVTRPVVLGPADLLRLGKLSEVKAPYLVYFTNKEFKTLLKGAVQSEVRLRAPVMVFTPAAGGMVQSGCESPPGQVCVGRWTPAGPGHSAGVYFGCNCKVPRGEPTPRPLDCHLFIDASGTLRCEGKCTRGKCTLLYTKEPASGQYRLTCSCRVTLLKSAKRTGV